MWHGNNKFPDLFQWKQRFHLETEGHDPDFNAMPNGLIAILMSCFHREDSALYPKK
jgi:hypothetical protein